MPRPVTLFTGQFADIPLEQLAKKATGWGYDGLELACWGDHLDVAKAAADTAYCAKQRVVRKKGELSPDRLKRLEAIGFRVDVRETRN